MHVPGWIVVIGLCCAIGCVGKSPSVFPIEAFNEIVGGGRQTFVASLSEDTRREFQVHGITDVVYSLLQLDAPYRVTRTSGNGAVLAGKKHEIVVEGIVVDGEVRFAFPDVARDWERWIEWFRDVDDDLRKLPSDPFRDGPRSDLQ